ncbi:peptidylprolyl isomerase [candidate division KSB1 bacterium]|nr:peptidylprolyl isomerase [candidate division KSB1 bacterium]
MKMKIALCLLLTGLAGIPTVYGQGLMTKYVGVPEENLRSAPQGKKVGTVLEGTEIAILEEEGNWALVRVTAWIWKPSLVLLKPRDSKNQMRALHILVNTAEKADHALQQIRSGTPFETVAKQFSILPNAAKGGDLGLFSPEDFESPIREAISSLKVGQVSAIIQTDFGYNIFKRLK